MLFDKLTNEDRDRIEDYIDAYGGSCDHKRAPLDEILQYWNKSKAWLEPYFGDSLIKEIPITYEEGEDELNNKVYNMFETHPEYHKFIRSVQNLYPFPHWFERNDLSEEEYNSKQMAYEAMCAVIAHSALVNNKISLVDFINQKSYTFTLPNGEKYTVQDGAKPMRVLRKFAEIVEFNNVDFEHFRNDHSRCLQSKTLTGTLCLSIHPLDFMTMSDNANDWSSCMSWRNGGEYRLGTVEMMNSENIICAYLKSDHEKIEWYGHEWNSKKWRCLYIATKDNFLMSVKSYPFYNGGLTSLVLAEIAKLLGWKNTAPTLYDFQQEHREGAMCLSDGRKIHFELNCDAMYCDFGASDHWFILGENERVSQLSHYYFNYSGMANCMWCGSIIDDASSDEGYCDRVICRRDYAYCTRCDYEMDEYSDDWYWVHDERVCPNCAENYTVWDVLTDERIWEDEAITVYLSRSNKDKLTDDLYNCKSIYTDADANQDQYRWWKDYFNISEFRYDDETSTYYVCPKDCTPSALRYLFGFYSDGGEIDLQDYITDQAEEA